MRAGGKRKIKSNRSTSDRSLTANELGDGQRRPPHAALLELTVPNQEKTGRTSVSGWGRLAGGSQFIMPPDVLGGERVIVDGQLIEPPNERAYLVQTRLSPVLEPPHH